MAGQKIILITGGAGFLGSHLCDAFINKGYEVVAADSLFTGSDKNIAHLKDNPAFTFIKHDICLPLPLAISKKPFKKIANLASPASPPHYQRLALETLRVGAEGVRNMLDLAMPKKARLFQASTSEVYGDPTIHPQPETYHGNVNPYGPRSMYDESKRYAEALIYAYRHKFGLNTGIVRIFNTYGPRMDPKDGRVVTNLIMQALQNKPLTIYGDGTQTRSFCYVDDLIDGFVKMIESDVEGPINLGNPGEFTMLELAEKVLKLTGSKSKIVHEALPGDDPLQRKPEITRAKQQLHWQPKIDLETGLEKTIEYLKSINNF